MQQTFFENTLATPLASRLRPETLEHYVGQSHLVGEGRVLHRLIEKDQLCSMIFYGPPGVGKTTLARIIANHTKSHFVNFSAVTSGIREIKDVMEKAERVRRMGERTILFVDEIHRFNKAQQDAFLPYVEKGSIVLIGATTENPSFEVNAALLSRCKVFMLKMLGENDILGLLKSALTREEGFGGENIVIGDDELSAIASFSNGDARVALNTLEMAVLNSNIEGDKTVIDASVLELCIGKKMLLYDKSAEEHYNIISALHKSMRNSDPDAAVYWLSRMLEAGEDPLYVARRVVRFASEDVGMADSRGLQIAVAAYQACHFLGMPECTVHLSHAVVYLSLAPKSNACYVAYNEAAHDAKTMLAEPVPFNIRNAPTKMMKEQGYGKGYQYAHDAEEKITKMQCLPDSLKNKRYYRPAGEGSEAKVKERLEAILEWKSRP